MQLLAMRYINAVVSYEVIVQIYVVTESFPHDILKLVNEKHMDVFKPVHSKTRR